MKTASIRRLSRRTSSFVRFFSLSQPVSLDSSIVAAFSFFPSLFSLLVQLRPLGRVAINAPLKEIGNPFVGDFRRRAYGRQSSHEHRHTPSRILHSICKGTFPHGHFSFSRGCTRCWRAAPHRREGEIAFTWNLESISRSRGRDTIGLFFRGNRSSTRFVRESTGDRCQPDRARNNGRRYSYRNLRMNREWSCGRFSAARAVPLFACSLRLWSVEKWWITFVRFAGQLKQLTRILCRADCL